MTPAPAEFGQLVKQNEQMWMALGNAMPGTVDAQGAASQHEPQKRQSAAYRLIMNHEAVLRDVCNGTQQNVIGHPLTQTDLARVHPTYAPVVDQFLQEVARRLLGNPMTIPVQRADQNTLGAWNQAAMFIMCRLQGSAAEKVGRAPDLDPKEAMAMRAVLAEVGAGR